VMVRSKLSNGTRPMCRGSLSGVLLAGCTTTLATARVSLGSIKKFGLATLDQARPAISGSDRPGTASPLSGS
jgi:hypothetical protein